MNPLGVNRAKKLSYSQAKVNSLVDLLTDAVCDENDFFRYYEDHTLAETVERFHFNRVEDIYILLDAFDLALKKPPVNPAHRNGPVAVRSADIKPLAIEELPITELLEIVIRRLTDAAGGLEDLQREREARITAERELDDLKRRINALF